MTTSRIGGGQDQPLLDEEVCQELETPMQLQI